MYLQISEWFLEHTEQLLASANFTLTLTMIFIISTVAYTLRKFSYKKNTDLFFLILSVIFWATGWGLHRIYYGLYNTYRFVENDVLAAWLYDNRYLTLIPSTLVFIGCALMLGPIISVINPTISRLKSIVLTFFGIVCVSWLVYWQLYEYFDMVRTHNGN